MALVLNTENALVQEGIVYAVIGVNENNDVFDYVTTSRAFTPDAGVVFGSGTYGRHFKTDAANENVDISAPIGFDTTNYPNQTIMMVCNTVTGENSRGLAQGVDGANVMGFAYDDTDGKVGITRVATVSTIDIKSDTNVSGTSFSVAGVRNGSTDANLFVNGAAEGITYVGALGANGSSKSVNQLGAYSGQGSMFAEYVWFVWFTRVLTPTEILDLHNSLGANNQFALVKEGTQPVTFGGSIENQTIKVSEAITPIDISANFSGSETPFTYAVQAGTLPTGLTLDPNTGIISGTNNDGISQSGIVIRATDQTPNTADTNAFDINVDTSIWGVLGSDIPSTGKDGAALAFPSLVLPADNNNRYRATNVIKPTTLGSGRLEIFEDFSATLIGAPDGVHVGSFTLEENAVDIGTVNLTFSVGATGTIITGATANYNYQAVNATISQATGLEIIATTPNYSYSSVKATVRLGELNLVVNFSGTIKQSSFSGVRK